MIESSEVLELPESVEQLDLGLSAKVELDSIGTAEYGKAEIVFHLVSPIDSSILGPVVGKIEQLNSESEFLVSSESPLGLSLIGKKIGDVVKCDSPGGSYNVKVREIQPSTLFSVDI